MLYAIGIYEEVIENADKSSHDKWNFQTFEEIVSPFFNERPRYDKNILKIVYSYINNLKRTKTAQQFNPLFFQLNQLENADQILFETDFFSTMSPDKIYLVKKPREFNYLCKLSLSKAVVVIASKKALDETEQLFLVKNIAHTIVRPGSINNVTIQKILENPLGYTGKDILITAVQDKNKKVIQIAHDNIKKVIDRGEKLESIEEKAIQLHVDSQKFENSAKKLNSSCCGGWVRNPFY